MYVYRARTCGSDVGERLGRDVLTMVMSLSLTHTHSSYICNCYFIFFNWDEKSKSNKEYIFVEPSSLQVK